MGQFWKIINLDKRQCHDSALKLGEFFFYGFPSECLTPALERFEPTSSFLPDRDATVKQYNPRERLRDHPGLYFAKTALRSPKAVTLVNIPAELIREIHKHMDSIHDLVFFSATCQVLWEIGRAEIYHRVIKLAAAYSWAGDRIICVGDYLENDDVPESILSAEEKAEFLAPRVADEDEDECYEGWGLSHFPFPPGKHLALKTLLDMRDDSEDAPALRHGQLLEDAPALRQLCDFESLKHPAPRILRNLTRQQYVRESAILDLRKKMSMAKVEASENIGIGEVVLSRICFSSDGSTAMGYGGGIHRGVWAGDRFDVVSAEWLGTDAASGWTDVSTEVLEELEEIWEAY